MENKLRKIIKEYQWYGISLENRASLYFCDNGDIAISYAGDEGIGKTLEEAIGNLVHDLETNDYYLELVELDKKSDRDFHEGV